MICETRKFFDHISYDRKSKIENDIVIHITVFNQRTSSGGYIAKRVYIIWDMKNEMEVKVYIYLLYGKFDQIVNWYI